MPVSPPAPPPTPRSRIISLYFMEHRAKLIDLAAFLDRVDRAADDVGHDDFRVAALRSALRILDDGKPERARRVLELFSDHSSEPIEKAPMKGALGAVDPADAAGAGGAARAGGAGGSDSSSGGAGA